MAQDGQAFSMKKGIGGTLSSLTSGVAKKATGLAGSTKATFDKSTTAVLEAIDQNGNGEIDIEDVIILGLKTPGVRISRSDFLRQEFFKRYPKATIDDAVAYNPAHAGIPLEEIDEIAEIGRAHV